jgi:hypothetical protein
MSADHPFHKDPIYRLGYFCGAAAAMCEMAMNEAKNLSLSHPFPAGEEAALRPCLNEKASQYGVSFYLEKDLMRTELFADVDMTGLWVYLIYKKPEMLEQYLALKKEEHGYLQQDTYSPAKRRDLGLRFGTLLGYSPDYLEQKLGRHPPDPAS